MLMLTKILLHVAPAAGLFKLLAKFILNLLWSLLDGAQHAATKVPLEKGSKINW